MNERRRILHDDGGGADVVTLRVTTTDGSTNVGIEMVVTNGNNVYPVTTDSQGKAVITGLSGGCTIDCSTHVISVTQFTATGTMTVDISAYVDSFPVGEVRTYGYTATVAEVPVVPGTYKLQVWGAQGGSGSSYTGGKGGYSEGVVTLSQPTTLYVFVGGQGSASGNGGWNGGGGGSGYCSYNSGGDSGYSYFGCGGGATDIATVSSSMSYSSYRTARDSASLLSRMIVAGGGSGGSYAYRSYTTSSSSWTSWGSLSGGPNITDGTYTTYMDPMANSGLSKGKTYRVTSLSSTNPSFVKNSDFKYFVIVARTSSGGWISQQTAGLNESFTTPSSSNVGFIGFCVSYNGNNYSSSVTVTVTIEEYTTTSSTSTSSDYTYGYVGGGVNGGGYSSTYYGQQSAAGSNGAFGLGANQTVTNYRYAGGCGGGGWYGGGNSYADSGISTVKCSGGGSGFVNIAANASYRPSGYTGLQLDSGATYAGNTSFPNTAGTGNETGHAGNGYAKITRFAYCAVTLRIRDEEDSPVTGASVTVSNSENTYSLTTDSNGEATQTVINGTYTVNCQGYSLDVTSITVSGNQTFDFSATELLDFSYTGAAQTKTLKAGTYKIECWGAQGGSYNTSYPGGKGGYSVGNITLEEDTTLYIMVGGQGNGNTSTGTRTGGFNGGGNAYCSSTAYANGSGGGATDVRIGQNSLYARVIVAGGGGGVGSYSASYRYAGGAGGGTTGVTPSQYSTSYPAGTGGTQTARGTSYYSTTADSTSYGNLAAFGTGGSYKSTSYPVAGGGGGWYGGGYAGNRAAAGGGSGYVYTQNTKSSYPSGCLLTDAHLLDFAQTIAGNTSMPSTSGGTETGHTGNGFVRISKVTYNTVTLHFETEGEPLEGAAITVTITGMSKTATTDSNGDAVFHLPNGTYTVSCGGYALDSTSLTVSGDTSKSYEASEVSVHEYSYTGAVQSDTLSAGTYKLECWGAQGGNAVLGSYTGIGGKGGYSVGTLVVDTDTQLYIMVGGQGTFNSGSGAATAGGFNGGGAGYNYSTEYTAAGGGGASDIRIGQNSLFARVIVAGGGGGSGVYSTTAGTGGYGGGTSGGTGSVVYSSYGVGTGGTQTSAGTCNGGGQNNGSASFGIGASKTSGSSGYNGAGGGGGWYGGGCGGAVSNCGGGGSGYVYNSSTASSYPSGCLLNSSHYLANSQTIAGNASMPSTSGSTETGHSGNGFVRITKI